MCHVIYICDIDTGCIILWFTSLWYRHRLHHHLINSLWYRQRLHHHVIYFSVIQARAVLSSPPRGSCPCRPLGCLRSSWSTTATPTAASWGGPAAWRRPRSWARASTSWWLPPGVSSTTYRLVLNLTMYRTIYRSVLKPIMYRNTYRSRFN